MIAATEGILFAVLANPPLTEGQRTLRRVALAAELLGFTDVEVANLFVVPSHATGAIAVLGIEEGGWLEARASLERGLDTAQGVLLAYGATAPTGEARIHFRRQVEWLSTRIAARRLPTWNVGDGPRHPSRWQRWTSRAHPAVPFAEALRSSLVLVRTESADSPLGYRQASRGAEALLGQPRVPG